MNIVIFGFPCGRRPFCGLATASLLALFMFPAAVIAAPKLVVVTISSVECTQEDECRNAGLEAATESWPDFYAKIFINGAETQTARAADDQSRVENMGWTATATIDDVVMPFVPIGIQIWDHDSTSGDDLGDASPLANNNNLDVILNMATGTWTGQTTSTCVSGDGVDSDDDEYYPIKVCFDITAGTDQDGDGLLDRWETAGFDANGDGIVDVDLPRWGADPLHKDIFLELDYEAGRSPTRDGINAMKRAFALAPLANPDGRTGITLHVDVGKLIDTGADKAGLKGSCTNGIDDDGDKLTDGGDTSCFYLDSNREVGPGDCKVGIDDSDPDCQVGDNLDGGGGVVPTIGACGLDSVFAAAKLSNFNALRSRVFRYAVQAAAPPNPPAPAPPLNCVGGQGEIGGNDFISHNLDAGTLMHELGHTLNLHHGGSVDGNCKPNYLSVMNYNLQGGIPRVGGGVILDYSPPRQSLSGSTRSVPLGPLVENALDENNKIDPADPLNQAVFMNLSSVSVTLPANANPNFSGDANDPPFEAPVTANIDNGIPSTPAAPGVPAAPAVGAPGCANGANDSTLNGDNDWNAVVLNFRQFAAGAEGEVIAPPPENNPTDEDLTRMYQERHTTNLAVTLVGTPNPVASGTDIAFAATVTNQGPNPADAAELTLTLPVETARAGLLPAGCSEPSPGVASCMLGTLFAGASRIVTLQAHTPADLVYNAGAPLTVTASASVKDLVGTELNGADNSADQAVKVVAVADLEMAALMIENPPIRMRTGENVVISLRSKISSGGPSSPMDTLPGLTGKADAGAMVSPTQLTTSQIALRQGETREVNDHAILFCRTPGVHAFVFTHVIGPARVPDTDPNSANNQKSAELKVECAGPQEVAVNFLPGRFPNRVRAVEHDGVLAILTTAAGEGGRVAAFDASDVVMESLRLGTRRMIDGLEPGIERFEGAFLEDSFERAPPETVQDGDRDLIIFNFDVSASGIQPNDTEFCVKGLFKSRVTHALEEFNGCDSAEVVQ